jgi:hypothetical protein
MTAGKISYHRINRFNVSNLPLDKTSVYADKAEWHKSDLCVVGYKMSEGKKSDLKILKISVEQTS